MATPTKYTYSISVDFPNGAMAPDRLTQEIRSSAITIALDRIDTAGDICDIWFKDVLPAVDQTALGGLVAAHSGQPLPGSAQPVSLEGGSTQIGIPAVQVLNLPDTASDLVKSWQITAAAQVTEVRDIFIGDDLVGAAGKCYLAGGEYRCRTNVAEGSALNFSLVDRDDVLGIFALYGLSRTRLSGLTLWAGGTIVNVAVGQYVRGDISLRRAKVLSVGVDYVEVTFHDGAFSDGEGLSFEDATGTPTGVTCDLGTWDEGDVIEVQTSVKDEWIEGYDVRGVHPGGSKEIPEGMYFRVKFFNNHATDPARVKVSLSVGRM
jgi:hypothetical protein